jgi:hypothetical protein
VSAGRSVAGRADRMLAFRMERADWETVRRDDIVIEGLDACLGTLGLEEPTG